MTMGGVRFYCSELGGHGEWEGNRVVEETSDTDKRIHICCAPNGAKRITVASSLLIFSSTQGMRGVGGNAYKSGPFQLRRKASPRDPGPIPALEQ